MNIDLVTLTCNIRVNKMKPLIFANRIYTSVCTGCIQFLFISIIIAVLELWYQYFSGNSHLFDKLCIEQHRFYAGIAAFEVEYANWVEEQNKQICELRNSLNTQISDVELGILVESGLGHYSELFGMKAKAAKADVFYVISGMFKTSAERFFLWIGGFRPSEVLKVILYSNKVFLSAIVVFVWNKINSLSFPLVRSRI